MSVPAWKRTGSDDKPRSFSTGAAPKRPPIPPLPLPQASKLPLPHHKLPQAPQSSVPPVQATAKTPPQPLVRPIPPVHVKHQTKPPPPPQPRVESLESSNYDFYDTYSEYSETEEDTVTTAADTCILSPECVRASNEAARILTDYLRNGGYTVPVCALTEQALATAMQRVHVALTKRWKRAQAAVGTAREGNGNDSDDIEDGGGDDDGGGNSDPWALHPCIRCLYYQQTLRHHPYHSVRVPKPTIEETGTALANFATFLLDTIVDQDKWTQNTAMGSWVAERKTFLASVLGKPAHTPPTQAGLAHGDNSGRAQASQQVPQHQGQLPLPPMPPMPPPQPLSKRASSKLAAAAFHASMPEFMCGISDVSRIGTLLHHECKNRSLLAYVTRMYLMGYNREGNVALDTEAVAASIHTAENTTAAGGTTPATAATSTPAGLGTSSTQQHAAFASSGATEAHDANVLRAPGMPGRPHDDQSDNTNLRRLYINMENIEDNNKLMEWVGVAMIVLCNTRGAGGMYQSHSVVLPARKSVQAAMGRGTGSGRGRGRAASGKGRKKRSAKQKRKHKRPLNAGNDNEVESENEAEHKDDDNDVDNDDGNAGGDDNGDGGGECYEIGMHGVIDMDAVLCEDAMPDADDIDNGGSNDDDDGQGGRARRKPRRRNAANAQIPVLSPISAMTADGKTGRTPAGGGGYGSTRYTPCTDKHVHTGLLDRDVLPDDIQACASAAYNNTLPETIINQTTAALASSATCIFVISGMRISWFARRHKGVRSTEMLERTHYIARCFRNMAGDGSYTVGEFARAVHHEF